MSIEQALINHVVFVVDDSASMRGLESQVPKVFDNQVKYLAARSQQLDQETRASVYFFGSRIKNVFYDKDVLRLPSLVGLYQATGGSTKLVDGALQAIEDLEKTAQLYGDHSFLIYVITDGGENDSRRRGELAPKVRQLPDNWTLVTLVPDTDGVREAKSWGFPAENIDKWDATSVKGIEEVGRRMEKATDNFMRARSMGVKTTGKSLFSLDLNSLSASKVVRTLQQLRSSEYTFYPVLGKKAVEIRDFVEGKKRNYETGKAFYQLMKKETIQANKQVCVVDKQGRVFGGREARKLLGLPNENVYVAPTQHPDLDIFVQSTSVNRHLIPGTRLLVLN